ncbi:fibronectin type III domain-containing protein [Fibrella aestuarina BUZ 2]|uniref:Fibronectin type III domain-containing protein n=1 Tax=Fibrella aestuarina BUZ 2 TaxID=1166018 RepID=I0KD09_9BACT|nr:putative Ig domain-containing protein [Fibrella aestuarina]CCH02012.1 fibronectin type III domain-containing protein [Fibrella aestuarina BUZ 2]
MPRYKRSIQVTTPLPGDRYRWDGSDVWYLNALSVDPDGQPDFAPGTFRFFYDREGYGIEYAGEVVITDTGAVHVGAPFERDRAANGDTDATKQDLQDTTTYGAETSHVITVGGLQLYALPDATAEAEPAYLDQLPDGRFELRRRVQSPDWQILGYYEEALIETVQPDWAVQGYYEEAALATDTPLNPPTQLIATRSGAQAGTLTWTDTNTTETAYRLERRNEGDTAWIFLNTVSANVTTLTLSAIPYGIRQQYRARAERVIDGVETVSDWSAIATLRIAQFSFAFALYGQGNAPDKLNELPANARVTVPKGGANIGCTVRATNNAVPTLDDYDSISFEIRFASGLTGGFSEAQGQPQGNAYYAFPRPDGAVLQYGACTARFRLWQGGFVIAETELTWTFLAAGTAPSKPTGLNAVANTSTQTRLDWSDTADNEDLFEIQTAAAGTTNWVAAGQTGPNSTTIMDLAVTPAPGTKFRVRAVNSVGASDWSNEAVIASANTAPTLPAVDNRSATSGQAFSVTLPAGSDADGDPLSYSLTPIPAGLTFNAATRVLSGTPTAVATTVLTYTVSDGRGGATSRGWTLTVASGNRPPTLPAIPDQVLYTHYDYGQVLGYGFQLPEGSDPEGGPLAYALLGLPEGISFFQNSPYKRWAGYIAAGKEGTYTVRYTATDNANQTATSSATWTVLRSRIRTLHVGLGSATTLGFKGTSVLMDDDTLLIDIERDGERVETKMWTNVVSGAAPGWYSFDLAATPVAYAPGQTLKLTFYSGHRAKYPESHVFHTQTITVPAISNNWLKVYDENAN